MLEASGSPQNEREKEEKILGGAFLRRTVMSAPTFDHQVKVCQAPLAYLFTKIRDRCTPSAEFRRYARRLMAIIIEEALLYVQPRDVQVETPVPGCIFDGVTVATDSIVAISIIRAGDSMLDIFLELVPEASAGKILIQRNEETASPEHFYSKVPPLKDKNVVLLDPMLATGGSAIVAIRIVIERGALEENITFVNVISCPEGLAAIRGTFPRVKIVTGFIDSGLNKKKYIVPGLGDFGDRYFGTV